MSAAPIAEEAPVLVARSWAGCQVYRGVQRIGYITRVGRSFRAVRFFLPFMSYRLADSSDEQTEEDAVAFIVRARTLAAVMDAS